MGGSWGLLSQPGKSKIEAWSLTGENWASERDEFKNEPHNINKCKVKENVWLKLFLSY